MQLLVWKLRIVVLWVLLGVAMTTAYVLYLLEPGVVDDIRAGEVEGMDTGGYITLLFAGFALVPLAMAYLTLVLKDTASRWATGALAVVITLVNVVDVAGHVGDAFRGEALAVAVSVVAGLLLVWHAWKWPSAGRLAASVSLVGAADRGEAGEQEPERQLRGRT